MLQIVKIVNTGYGLDSSKFLGKNCRGYIGILGMRYCNKKICLLAQYILQNLYRSGRAFPCQNIKRSCLLASDGFLQDQ